MTDKTSLKEIWQRLSAVSGDSRVIRVTDSRVLGQYCGVTDTGQFVFYSQSEAKPHELEQLKALQILIAKDRVGKWVRSFVLLDSEFFDEYSELVEELSEAAQRESSEEEALLAETKIYERWLAFYKKRNSFTEAMARGLYGELWVLRTEHAARKISWSTTLKSWCGPEDSPQDFVFGSDEAIEVKTIQLASDKVKINGSEQLLFPGSLVLRVLRVSSADHTTNGETLGEIVAEIESKLTPTEQSYFGEKLSRVGYDPKSDVAVRSFFTVIEEIDYAVKDDFPRITSNLLNPSLGDVSYTVKLSGIKAFKKVAA